MAKVVETAGRSGFVRLKPGFARLAALPGPCREAKNFDLDAATLQGAGQNIGAGGGDRDRPPAHRAGVINEQAHHRIAEIHILLTFEGKWLPRIGDHARQPRRIEDAFIEVEFPEPVSYTHL